jgi:hypothetical protein
MEIEINDLRIGDEILVLGQVPKLLTILENPSEKGFYKYNPTKVQYNTFRCRNNVQRLLKPKNSWNRVKQIYDVIMVEEKTNVLEPCEEGEGETKKIDLNYKRMWKLN